MTWKVRLRKPTWFDFVQGLERAGRAFGVSFIALYPLGNIAQSVTSWVGSDGELPIIDYPLAQKAALAGLTAVGALAWRWLFPDVGRSRIANPLDDEEALAAQHEVTHPHGPGTDVDVATDD